MKYLIIFLVGIISLSCASRKVHKEIAIVKEESVMVNQTMDTTIFHKEDTHNTITSIDVEEDEIIITPIDTSKEMKVDNKVYKNVVIKKSHKKDRTKTETKDTVKVDSSSAHSERSIALNIKEGSINMKTSEKEDGSSFYIYSFLFLLLLICLLYLANKFKNYLF